MSVCGQSGQAEEDSASEEVTASTKRDMDKQKPASKVVRVLTVLAYLLSVSLAAILLSVYYVCVWRSPELPLETAAEASARRDNLSHLHVQHAPHHALSYGGGDTTVNGDISHLPPENITGGFTEDRVSEPTASATPNALPDTTTPLYNETTEFNITEET